MPRENNNDVETELERRILDSIERVGFDWQSTNLWFPLVERETLALEVNASDANIQAAIVGLIRKKKLIHVNPEGWRTPHFSPAPDIRGPILPAPGCLALAYRMPMVPQGAIERALEKELPINRTRIHLPAAGCDNEKANWVETDLTQLDARIIRCIDNIGWYTYLWFPVVSRAALNFGPDDCEEVVHAAIVSLIEKGALIFRQESVDDNPSGWYPAPGLLEIAERKIRNDCRHISW